MMVEEHEDPLDICMNVFHVNYKFFCCEDE
jgi:hypothetical protein